MFGKFINFLLCSKGGFNFIMFVCRFKFSLNALSSFLNFVIRCCGLIISVRQLRCKATFLFLILPLSFGLPLHIPSFFILFHLTILIFFPGKIDQSNPHSLSSPIIGNELNNDLFPIRHSYSNRPQHSFTGSPLSCSFLSGPRLELLGRPPQFSSCSVAVSRAVCPRVPTLRGNCIIVLMIVSTIKCLTFISICWDFWIVYSS